MSKFESCENQAEWKADSSNFLTFLKVFIDKTEQLFIGKEFEAFSDVTIGLQCLRLANADFSLRV